MSAQPFWQPFEVEIASFDDLVTTINSVMKKATANNRRFAWRGLVNHTWALHSSLYRRLLLTNPGVPEETHLAEREDIILADLHRWGLHSPPHSGRLSVLNQLAMLQHYGAPTRLVDITFNAWVGAWFAVEEKWQNGAKVFEDVDGRLFAVDVTERLINEHDDRRGWEDCLKRPWNEPLPVGIKPKEWTSSVFAWKPASLDARIFAQNGGFLLGGVPATKTTSPTVNFQFPKSPNNADGFWRISEARKACCLALRPHVFNPRRGISTHPGALYTFRIAHAAKQDIRNKLEKMFGYQHSTIYPDYSGFASFGTPTLKTS